MDIEKTKTQLTNIKVNKMWITLFYIMISLIFYTLFQAKIIYDFLAPFSCALFFALIMMRLNVNFLSISYIVASMLNALNMNNVYLCINVIVVAYVLNFLRIKYVKLVNFKSVYIFYGLANICYVYFNCQNRQVLLATLLSMLFGVITLYIFICLFQPIKSYGFNTRLNKDELVCGCLLIILIVMGISNINSYPIEVIKLIAPLFILIITYTMSASHSLVMGTLIGLGYTIGTNNVCYIASFITYSLLALAFKSNIKIFSSISIILVEIAFGLYFKVYDIFNVYSIICVAISVLIFLVIPNRYILAIRDLLGGRRDKIGERIIINRTKQGICKRMNELSLVFAEMDKVFKNMVKGCMTKEQGKQLISEELASKVCVNCKERNKCLKVSGNLSYEIFDEIVTAGIKKGKITLLDMPRYLTSKCPRINTLISNVNELLNSFKHYSIMVNNMDSSRLLIADQLAGVSSILKSLSNEISTNVSFDKSSENRIIEDLSYHNIMCHEVIVYKENDNSKIINLIVNQNLQNHDMVEKIVSKSVKQKMNIISQDSSVGQGVQSLTLCTKSNYDIVFGSSSVSKNGVLKNGDTHTLIKIDNNKFMLALCDGMGTGSKAHQISSLTINLIENFYKGGFDNQIILKSVNKLLAINNQENFSTVDLCVMDFKDNFYDFIKLGATNSYIKRNGQLIDIECDSLPIGVLDEVKPHITKQKVEQFDMIIMMSDGVSDSFENEQSLKDYILSINTINPQSLSQEILDQAIQNKKSNINDDMTVICVRVFPI